MRPTAILLRFSLILDLITTIVIWHHIAVLRPTESQPRFDPPRIDHPMAEVNERKLGQSSCSPHYSNNESYIQYSRRTFQLPYQLGLMDGGERVLLIHTNIQQQKEKEAPLGFLGVAPQPGPYNILADRPIGCRSWPVYLVLLVLPFHPNSLI